MPPIRTENDKKAVWNALSNNQIDTIGTDHVANQLKLKLEVMMFGVLCWFFLELELLYHYYLTTE